MGEKNNVEKMGECGRVTTGGAKPPVTAGQNGAGGTGGPRIPPKGGSGTAPPTNQRK